MKVMLVEDHPAMRLGLATAFELVEEIELVGEAEDGQRALELATEHRPEVVLLDLRIKGEVAGVEICRELKSLPDPPRVVIYTAYNSSEDVFATRLAGADSYVHKGEEPQKVMEVIRETYEGKRVWLMGYEQDEISSRLDSLSSGSDLTPREKEIFPLLVRQYTNARIARELCISPRTAKNHASSILKKLGVGNRTELP